jgi:hypothetical protein
VTQNGAAVPAHALHWCAGFKASHRFGAKGAARGAKKLSGFKELRFQDLGMLPARWTQPRKPGAAARPEKTGSMTTTRLEKIYDRC